MMQTDRSRAARGGVRRVDGAPPRSPLRSAEGAFVERLLGTVGHADPKEARRLRLDLLERYRRVLTHRQGVEPAWLRDLFERVEAGG